MRRGSGQEGCRPGARAGGREAGGRWRWWGRDDQSGGGSTAAAKAATVVRAQRTRWPPRLSPPIPPPPRHPLGRHGTMAAVAAEVAAVCVPAQPTTGRPANRPGGRRDRQTPARHVRAAGVICGHKRRIGRAKRRRFMVAGVPPPAFHPSPTGARPPKPIPPPTTASPRCRDRRAGGGAGEGRRAAASGWRMWKQTRPSAAAERGRAGRPGGRASTSRLYARRARRCRCPRRPPAWHAAPGAQTARRRRRRRVHTAQSAPTGGRDWSAVRGKASRGCLSGAGAPARGCLAPRLGCRAAPAGPRRIDKSTHWPIGRRPQAVGRSGGGGRRPSRPDGPVDEQATGEGGAGGPRCSAP